MAHIQKFLLELGQGFAFIGRQYPLTVGSKDFFIDMLFYHYNPDDVLLSLSSKQKNLMQEMSDK